MMCYELLMLYYSVPGHCGLMFGLTLVLTMPVTIICLVDELTDCWGMFYYVCLLVGLIIGVSTTVVIIYACTNEVLLILFSYLVTTNISVQFRLRSVIIYLGYTQLSMAFTLTFVLVSLFVDCYLRL